MLHDEQPNGRANAELRIDRRSRRHVGDVSSRVEWGYAAVAAAQTSVTGGGYQLFVLG